MSYYWVGDKPLESLVLVPRVAGNALGNAFTSVSAVLVRPDGVTTLVAGEVQEQDGDLVVQVDFVGESWFPIPGLYQLRMTMRSPDGHQQRLDAVQLVVHADDGWHTLPSARSDWADAPLSDVKLWMLLELGKQAVLAFAPDLDDFEQPPLNYRQAQLMQARNLSNAGRVDPSSGETGGDGFAITPFPLDWQIKQLLRPKRARPVAL